MPVPTCTDDFVDLVRKSGLVSETRIDSFLQSHADAPTDPPQLAAHFIRHGLLTKFQAKQLVRGRYKNFLIGRYRVLEPLGVGGMSRVYLCEHAVMGHRVALKLLPAQPGTDPSLVERFFREARAAAAVNHPNIVRAHDFGEEPGKYYYLIMDFVDGINLHDLIQRHGPLSAVRTAHYVAQIAAGLQHIHECGLVHRDIKPGNLLLDRGGEIKILDLGLARFDDPEPGEAITKKYDERAILGTADFLAPEQAIQATRVDVRSDIYSLGATMYYLLAGRPPFPGDNITQKLLAHQLKRADALTSLRPDLPQELVDVVETMLAKRQEDRFQLPNEIVAALAPWTAEPIDAPSLEEIPPRGPATGGSSSFAVRPLPSNAGKSRGRSSITALPPSAAGLLSQTPRPRGRLDPAIFGHPFLRKYKWHALAGAGGVAFAAMIAWLLW